MTEPPVQALNKSTTPVDKPEDIFGLSAFFPYFTRKIYDCLNFKHICKSLKIGVIFFKAVKFLKTKTLL
ncbi:hypothetical protein AN476_04550 [Phaeobacter sp. 11ANDIMAR09]|nr:hypothetical protein AN476_04550 [Phaeobacter sp. 11ANDIMAR09]